MATTYESKSSSSDMCLYLLGFFIPPLAVFLRRGCAADFWINICLTILAWLPGVIHAWYVIGKYGRRETVVKTTYR